MQLFGLPTSLRRALTQHFLRLPQQQRVDALQCHQRGGRLQVRASAARAQHPAASGPCLQAPTKPCPCPVCTCPLPPSLTHRRRCSYTSTQLNQQSLQLQAGQCQLRFQEMAAVQAGWPPALLAKGPANGVAAFTCGAPLVAWGPQVSGFKRIIGKALYTW